MTRVTISLLLIGHFLGDFYFQNNKLALSKEKNFNDLLIHSSIYGLSIFFISLPVISQGLIKWLLLIAILHFAVDWLKFYINRKFKLNVKGKTRLYFIDQLNHIIVIILIVMIIGFLPETIEYTVPVINISNKLNINIDPFIYWALAVLIIIKPFSVTIRKVLYQYQPTTVDKEEFGHPGAGSLIGILERLLILLMLSQNQYTAIGFVLTAKSIARYNKIIENPQFSEYYLLGTLLSILLVVLAYILIIK